MDNDSQTSTWAIQSQHSLKQQELRAIPENGVIVDGCERNKAEVVEHSHDVNPFTGFLQSKIDERSKQQNYKNPPPLPAEDNDESSSSTTMMSNKHEEIVNNHQKCERPQLETTIRTSSRTRKRRKACHASPTRSSLRTHKPRRDMEFFLYQSVDSPTNNDTPNKSPNGIQKKSTNHLSQQESMSEANNERTNEVQQREVCESQTTLGGASRTLCEWLPSKSPPKSTNGNKHCNNNSSGGGGGGDDDDKLNKKKETGKRSSSPERLKLPGKRSSSPERQKLPPKILLSRSGDGAAVEPSDNGVISNSNTTCESLSLQRTTKKQEPDRSLAAVVGVKGKKKRKLGQQQQQQHDEIKDSNNNNTLVQKQVHRSETLSTPQPPTNHRGKEEKRPFRMVAETKLSSTSEVDEKEQPQQQPLIQQEERTPASSQHVKDGEKLVAESKAITTSKRRKRKEMDKEFSTSWICCECGEAECSMLSHCIGVETDDDDLIICEGTCRRMFHYPCAGLPRMPLPNESYICHDCQVGRHACAFCHTYGVDHVDVFPCSAVDRCGLFYHESCLVLRDIPFQLVPATTAPEEGGGDNNKKDPVKCTTNGSGEPMMRREFICPAHSCWTCSWAPPVLEEGEDLPDRPSTSRRGRKGKNKRSRLSNAFEKRSGGLMMRCLACPMAFHVTCIPPAARFHELALLCPEHASTHKLPELDTTHSVQAVIEDKMNQKYQPVNDENRAPKSTRPLGHRPNKFFRGMSGKVQMKDEAKHLQRELNVAPNQENHQDGTQDDRECEEDLESDGVVPFCLPCEIKDDIYSKPPSYKHVHRLQYNARSRPQRILPMSGEVCQCVDSCGEDCINRLLYVECVGEKGSKHSNCKVGKDCGNRRLSRRDFIKCKPKREQGRGWGLVTCSNVKAGDLVTEYVGEVIDASTKEKRLEQWAKDHPNDTNFYVMSLSNQWYIDAREVANLSRFINHSCQPNCRLTQVNVDGLLRNGIFALVDIPAGEFLSYDYRFDTKQDKDKFICRCGAKNCRGTMKQGLLSSSAQHLPQPSIVDEKQKWEQAKKDFEKDRVFVEDFYMRQEERRSQVRAMVPAANNNDEHVSSGVQNRNRERYTPRLFLWRNAVNGSDFETRLSKLNSNDKKVKKSQSSNAKNKLRRGD